MIRLLLALGALLVAVPAAHAQSGASDPHAALYATLQEGVDEDAMLDGLVKSFAEEMVRADPAIAELEKEVPGLSMLIAEATRPVFASYSDRVHRQYTPRMVDALRRSLTAEEADQVTAFYRSDVGRLVLRQVSRSAVSTGRIREGLTEDAISREAIERDVEATSARTLDSLTPQQMARLEAAIAATPAIMKLAEFQRLAAEIRVEMENAPLTAEEEAELTRLIEAAMEAELGPLPDL